MKNRVLRAFSGLLASLLLLCGGAVCANAAEAVHSENTVLVNGEEVQFDSYLIDGRTYVQLRELGDAVGFDVDWDDATKTVIINTRPNEELAELEKKLTNALRDVEDAKGMQWMLVLLLACAVGYIIFLHIRVLSPLQKLAELTGQMEELDTEELCRRAETVKGAPGKAARAIAAYIGSEEGGAVVKRGTGISEETYKMRVVDEICSSLLPQELKENTASMTFCLIGGVQKGTRRDCAFYDYFYLDENTLCLVVGQVPGGGITEALFAVVAQTAIRSRLRMGRSLIETMSDVNAQLYDFGGRNSVCALVGVLNTVSGQLTFVNAGGSMPFLMRSEERYEWLRTPVYAPLGANESVSYRSEVLRLNQGDRLFLYTADLGEMENRKGEKFSEQEFQSALNRSRNKTHSLDELLRYVQDEAAAFCESGDDVLSSAVLALEYKKGSKDYVFTMIRGTPEYATDVTEFMRKTLEDGGIKAKDQARLILLADELFTLCCRVCKAGTDIKVECGILPEENTFHLRMFAPMGGKSPLEGEGSASDRNAVEYIRSHTERVAFQSGIDRDMVEIISELS